MGQGSSTSLSVWLTLVVCLLSALTELATAAMAFMDPWNDLYDEHNADAFVDDTSEGANMKFCVKKDKVKI